MKKYLLATLILTISLSSFAYIPPIINASILNQKGEFQATVTYGTAGAEQTFSYAFDNEMYVVLNSSFTIDTVNKNGEKRKHYFFEGGFGYGVTSENWIFNLGGAYGYGSFYGEHSWEEQNYHYNNAYFEMQMHKFSILADIGLKKQYFELIFSNRFAMGYFLLDSDTHYLNSTTYSFYEPGITLKFGPGRVKFFTQGRLSLPLNNPEFNTVPAALSIGLVLHLGAKYEEKVDISNF